jgi:predicted O-linked N-acetylglucosamine transferase (SPINDLY family)
MKPGRNDPCPCGSGKKHKKCCAIAPAPALAVTTPPTGKTISLEEREALVGAFNAGQHEALETLAKRLIERCPDAGFAWKLLGASQYMRGLDSLHALESAAALSPDDVECFNLLGSALMKLGFLTQAESSLRHALQIQPDYAGAHFNLALALCSLERPEEAEACCRRAIELRPAFAEAHCQLGRILGSMQRAEESEACHRHALALRPNFAEAYNCLGNTLKSLDRLDEAEACFRRALEIDPGLIEASSNLLFMHNYTLSCSPAARLEDARRHGAALARQVSAPLAARPAGATPGRLRVGLVSGDLHSHPVGFFLEAVLARIDPARIELFAYPTRNKADALTARILPHFAALRPLTGLGDEAAARLIHEDGVDLLIDLSGHTAHNRLAIFAWRPASVQVSWLGYFATTGVAAIDYLIADPWTLPETENIYFTEAIWRLPETRLCFTPPDVDLPIAPLPALTNNYVTFGCFNNLAKMNDGVVALWARVLASIPDSRLYLKAKSLDVAAVKQSVVERFAAHGIGSDRMILEGFEPRTNYLSAYHRVDIALDPFPFTGGTTSAESLWMGVPVLTLPGTNFLSRQGVGLLMNAGLPEWIATDPEDYLARAVSHASHLEKLAALRAGLRQQVEASPIFDAERFAHHFEAALFGMWEAARGEAGTLAMRTSGG